MNSDFRVHATTAAACTVVCLILS